MATNKGLAVSWRGYCRLSLLLFIAAFVLPGGTIEGRELPGYLLLSIGYMGIGIFTLPAHILFIFAWLRLASGKPSVSLGNWALALAVLGGAPTILLSSPDLSHPGLICWLAAFAAVLGGTSAHKKELDRRAFT